MIVRSTAACTCRGGAAAYQADPRAIHACGRCEAHLHEEWADDTAVVHGADIVGKRSDSLRRVQAAGSGLCVCRQRWRIDWRTPARLRSASVSAIAPAGAATSSGRRNLRTSGGGIRLPTIACKTSEAVRGQMKRLQLTPYRPRARIRWVVFTPTPNLSFSPRLWQGSDPHCPAKAWPSCSLALFAWL